MKSLDDSKMSEKKLKTFVENVHNNFKIVSDIVERLFSNFFFIYINNFTA